MPDLIEPSRARREEFVNAQKEAWAAVSRLLGMVRGAYAAEPGDAGLAAAQSFGEALHLYERKGRALLVKVNSDDNPRTASRFGIRSIPTLVKLQHGREVARVAGARPAGQIVQFASA